jgi:LPS O-antigen subunit length determinant protein (WzzB/FepE family)
MATEQNPFPAYLPKGGQEQHDWVTLTRKLWDGKLTLIIAGLCGVLLGVAVALIIPPKYTATAVMVPQTNSPNQSQLSGLASLAGINIDLSQGNELSPVAYPKIVNSMNFKLDLLKSTFRFEEHQRPVSLYAYYTKGKPNDSIQVADTGLVTLTKTQARVKRTLDQAIFLSVDKKDGFVTLKVTLPEPLAAAEVARKVQEMLQREVIKLRTEKAQADLDFIQERFDVVKAEAEGYQESMVAGADRFRDLVSNMPRVGNTRLQTKYTIANSVFQELAKQLEQAKIQVKRDTPVFTVIEPVSVPYEKSGVRRIIIVFLFALMGGVAGILILLLKENLKAIKERWKHAANN